MALARRWRSIEIISEDQGQVKQIRKQGLFKKQKKIRETKCDVIFDEGNEDTVEDWLVDRHAEVDDDVPLVPTSQAPQARALYDDDFESDEEEDINIDCGSSSSHIDGDNRTWVGDTDFVTTGLTSKFKPIVETADSLTTLRYFPTGETNCYSNIPVDKGGKVLVRTRFNYGDYDGEDKAPKFDVVYDGKHRDSVVTTTSISGVRSEAIFIPESGNTSVCFFRTFLNEFPFVSTIEVRRLDDSMYTDLGPKEGFILQQRIAYGRVQELVRSPFDPYDRIWAATPLSTATLTSASTSINTTWADNRPPEIVLRTAWSRKDMAFYDITLPFSGVTFYIVLYFSEPLSLASDQKRSFYVNYDNKQVGPSLIVPPFGAVTQAVLRAVATTKLPYLTFKATPDSNLNPLINALELYVISNSGGNGTNTPSTGGGGGSPSTGGGGGTPSTGGGGGSPSTRDGGGSSGSGDGGSKSGTYYFL
ncbi:unnamed protein product [Microthlaspi erraticum]|uniref:Malectin-like domain-containing protein n=1 Tax=Microthlaspi erraticum TaxID=1685480 RepID=A0A6D2I697_9BRAS|nr:unnamed protein product [Microthlaspi erraticum]